MSLAELRSLAAESHDGVRQKVWTEPDPAAGADFTITVPGPQFWLPVALTATLTAGATGDDREPALEVTDGTTTIFTVAANPTVAATTALTFSWVRDLFGAGGDAGTTSVWSQLACPALPTGWTIGVVTENVASDDQWSDIAITALQITGGQPAQAGRREDAILEHWRVLQDLMR